MKIYLVFVFVLLSMNVYAQSVTQHVVRRGESFALIAKRYGMTEQELKAANPDYSVCYMGLKLTIPEKYAKAAVTSSKATEVSDAVVSNEEESMIASASAPERETKKKGGFWKKLGNFVSNVGDVAVSVASGMDEAGLLDKTGKAGEAIGGTADMVNMFRGKESNYLASATRESEDVSSGEMVVADESVTSPVSRSLSSSASNTSDADIVGLQNRLAYVNQRINELGQELADLLEEKNTIRNKQLSAAHEVAANQRKYQNIKNNSVTQRKRWTKASLQAQQLYVNQSNANNRKREQLNQERERLFAEKKQLIQRINELQGIETASSSGSGEKSYEYYQGEYKRWENRARDIYESLTNSGHRVKKNGEDVGGGADGSYGVVAFSGSTMALNDAQSEMRKIRREASRHGYDLPQSNYETISVSY